MTVGLERLVVLCGERVVGHLWSKSDAQLAFAYQPGWLDAPSAFAISLSLPLSPRPFEDGRAGRFFANLLPEGPLRSLLARRLGISERNDFALLHALGGECAGALSLVPESDHRGLPGEERYEPLDDGELEGLISAPPTLVQMLGDGKARLSLAGAQDKLPVLVRDGAIFLPQGGAPSSHILKLPSRDYAHLPANEVLTTSLAREAGLDVVELQLRRAGGASFCLVARYDRELDDAGKVHRIHQEDFCQALGFSPHMKYQLEGGPSFPQAFELVSQVSTEPLGDTGQLLRWQIFNLLAGNADGHAKNLSLVYGRNGSVSALVNHLPASNGGYWDSV